MSRSDRPSWGASTLTTQLSDLESPGPDHLYLVVFERASSSMFELPKAGAIVIGRAEGAELRLEDSWVSRQHARITLEGGAARIHDLGSQNGTFVNGERINGERLLAPGDLISICTSTLAFHSSSRPAAQERGERAFLELETLRQRAQEELERSLRYGRPLTLLSVSLGKPGAPRERVSGLLSGQLRMIDLPAWGGPEEIVVILPESDSSAGRVVAARLKRVLGQIAPQAQIGIASCPGDGCELDVLLAGAQRAARGEGPGGALATSAGSVLIGQHRVVVMDPAMTRLYSLIERLAAADLPVLICGETGTGKELAASALHAWSARRQGPMVALNCAAIAESLVESELFGHDKGAFSGATGVKPGLLESAGGGSLLLDEIGELPLATQAKLLRVLETKRVTRLGDVREREIDVRVLAATNRSLHDEVEAGRFRKDLFFRLSGATIWLPPLRHRPRELPILAQLFLGEACTRARRAPMTISEEALGLLAGHGWPGNVRELKNLMEYVAATLTEPRLEASHVAERIRQPGGAAPDVDSTWPPTPIAAAPRRAFRPIDEEVRELERDRMLAALEASGGNQSAAAELIAMPRRTFVAKLKAYDLRPGTPARARPGRGP